MLVVITEANDSEWLSPSFLQPKSETNWLPFLGAFKNINMPLQCKLYPMPKISNFFKTRRFKYATSFDLNMRYNNIQLSENASNLCATILQWGK